MHNYNSLPLSDFNASLVMIHPKLSRPGLSEFLKLVTFQMLWPSATTICGGRRPRIASL